ncbi:hypothetical protein [Dyella telluris]|uniref:Lipoprotein n=1 Tax=Dyella telluris TaxID=2763498 RepID=A0A7G8Q3A1_9GAMM|nr:hypothetical protein [Dyella telluris]QNK01259.1 hypothetical protein H8F01_19770 [Dyella telluris]
MTRPSLLCSLFAVAVLAGCSHHESTAAQPDATTAATTSDTPTEPDRRAPKPLEAYELINLSQASIPEPIYLGLIRQFRAAYWSVTPKDADRLAFDYLPEYRAETDSFKRADIARLHASELDQAYGDAQQRHDYAVRTQSLIQVFPYDAATGGFKVLFSTDDERSAVGVFRDVGNRHPYGAWSFRFVGIPRVASGHEAIYKPRDETEARAIEAALAAQRDAGQGSINAYAQYEGHALATMASASRDDTIFFGIDAITAVDRKTGKPLLTIGGKALGPIDIKCSTTRKALNLPEPVRPGGFAMSSESPC